MSERHAENLKRGEREFKFFDRERCLIYLLVDFCIYIPVISIGILSQCQSTLNSYE
jgi:hypothetical protein